MDLPAVYPPTNKPVLNSLITLVIALLLGGCLGSGGSSDGQAEAKAACGATEVRNLLVGEGRPGSMDLSLCFKASEASVDAGRFVTKAHFNGSRLQFTAEQVDRPRQTRLLILDPEGRTQLRINVVIRNTSGAALKARASHLIDQRGAILGHQEDRRIHDYILDVAYLQEKITWSEKQALMADWNPGSEASYARLEARINETGDILKAYLEGDASEDELAAAASSAIQMLPEHGEYGARRLSEVTQAYGSPVPDVSHGSLAYRESLDIVSRRSGNPNYGELIGDDWQFDFEFRFLKPVIDTETRS